MASIGPGIDPLGPSSLLRRLWDKAGYGSAGKTGHGMADLAAALVETDPAKREPMVRGMQEIVSSSSNP